MVIGCLWLSDVSVICRIVNPRWTSQKIGEVFSTECAGQGNDFDFEIQKFLSWHRSTCCVLMSWNLADGKLMKLCVAYLTQNYAWLFSCRYCADRVKNLPGQQPTTTSECSRFHRNRFNFSGVIAERVNTAETSRKVNPIFGWSLSSSRIMTKLIKKYHRCRITYPDILRIRYPI